LRWEPAEIRVAVEWRLRRMESACVRVSGSTIDLRREEALGRACSGSLDCEMSASSDTEGWTSADRINRDVVKETSFVGDPPGSLQPNKSPPATRGACRFVLPVAEPTPRKYRASCAIFGLRAVASGGAGPPRRGPGCVLCRFGRATPGTICTPSSKPDASSLTSLSDTKSNPSSVASSSADCWASVVARSMDACAA